MCEGLRSIWCLWLVRVRVEYISKRLVGVCTCGVLGVNVCRRVLLVVKCARV